MWYIRIDWLARCSRLVTTRLASTCPHSTSTPKGCWKLSTYPLEQVSYTKRATTTFHSNLHHRASPLLLPVLLHPLLLLPWLFSPLDILLLLRFSPFCCFVLRLIALDCGLLSLHLGIGLSPFLPFPFLSFPTLPFPSLPFPFLTKRVWTRHEQAVQRSDNKIEGYESNEITFRHDVLS